MTSFCDAAYRNNTKSIKWDCFYLLDKYKFGLPSDLIPLWIADMDCQVSPAILQALQDCVDHGIFGYTKQNAELSTQLCMWLRARHNFHASPEDIVCLNDTISSFIYLIYALTSIGDEIIVQQPQYPPLSSSITAHKRVLKVSPLVKHGASYTIDFDHLATLVSKKTKMFVLCNPHNPLGRVWTEKELRAILQFCRKHQLYLYSDDVHADIVFSPHQYIPITNIAEDYAPYIATSFSPVKPFNIPGLKISMLHISDATLRKKYKQILNNFAGSHSLSPFAIAAATAAYRSSGDWLDATMDALRNNRDMVRNFISENIPLISTNNVEATFLMWLDFSKLGLSERELLERIYMKARVGLSNGVDFGKGGEHCMRLNFACSKQLLEKAMASLAQHIQTNI